MQERDLGEEYGWKQVHGDVFRTPPQLMLFSAMLGAGIQCVAVAFVVIILALAGHLYESCVAGCAAAASCLGVVAACMRV